MGTRALRMGTCMGTCIAHVHVLVPNRLLDMGFAPQIRNIVDKADMPPRETRQTMMFSATFPRTVMRIADSFLNNPVMLKVGRVGGAAATVTQNVIYVDGRDIATWRTLVRMEREREKGAANARASGAPGDQLIGADFTPLRPG